MSIFFWHFWYFYVPFLSPFVEIFVEFLVFLCPFCPVHFGLFWAKGDKKGSETPSIHTNCRRTMKHFKIGSVCKGKIWQKEVKLGHKYNCLSNTLSL